MIARSQFSTCPETAKGGLIVCGMNWGGKTNTVNCGIETENSPWAPYFSHPENYSRGFQAPLVRWFSLWGYSLSYKTPTHLDRAIAQTNVFFDQSPRFLDRPEKEKWIHGITRLAEVVEQMDFSGILLVSTKVVDRLIWLSNRNEVPTWNRVVGRLQWDIPKYHRLKLRFGRNGVRHVAGLSHPSYGIDQRDVQKSAEEMRPWIDAVLKGHEMKS